MVEKSMIFDGMEHPLRPLPSVYGCPPEDIMKTIGLVVRPDGSRWWRRFANSVPIDGTLTTTSENNRCIIWFQVAHVHVAADQDIRVLCLVPNDGASEDMAYKSTLFQQDKVNWRILGREDLPENDAARYASVAWDCRKKREQKAASAV